MKSKAMITPLWRTASFGDAPDTSPMELSALGEHLDLCIGSKGRTFSAPTRVTNSVFRRPSARSRFRPRWRRPPVSQSARRCPWL